MADGQLALIRTTGVSPVVTLVWQGEMAVGSSQAWVSAPRHLLSESTVSGPVSPMQRAPRDRAQGKVLLDFSGSPALPDAGQAQTRVQGCLLMNNYPGINESVLGFSLLTLTLGPPPSPCPPHSSPQDILAPLQTDQALFPSTPLPMLFPCQARPSLSPSSSFQWSAPTENSSCFSGLYRPVPPSGPAWLPGSVF